MSACIGTTRQVRRTARGARQSGEYNVKSGPETVSITDLDGAHVYEAVMKSHDVWIVRFNPEYFEPSWNDRQLKHERENNV